MIGYLTRKLGKFGDIWAIAEIRHPILSLQKINEL